MKHLLFLLLPLGLFLIGCDDDDTFTPADYTAIEASAFDCPNVSSQTVLAADFQVNEITRFGNYFAFGGFKNLLITDENLEEVLLEPDINVREFLVFESKLIICAEDGLYQFTTDESFSTLATGVNCHDLAIGPGGELLIADAWVHTESVSEFVDGEIQRYTEIAPDQQGCLGLLDVTLGTNNTLWASTCEDAILKFNGRSFEQVFNTEDEPLLESSSADLFLLPYQDGVVLVAKNGVGFYQILKYTGGEWIELIHFSLLNSTTSSKEVFMARPSLVDVFIKDDLLYVATTLAGCEGIQRFDISKNEELTEDDYDAFEDPFYSSQCIDALYLDDNGDVYVIVNDNELIKVDCL